MDKEGKEESVKKGENVREGGEGRRGTGRVLGRVEKSKAKSVSLAISLSFVIGQANNRCGVCALFLATPHWLAPLPLPPRTIDLCK